ncbi:hypothetical protein KAW18_03910 [candidate division WOR-3 bacterium]|nr:hypothetical protein [candidate division WOR-3 bacterium]
MGIKWLNNSFIASGDTLVLSELMVLQSAAGHYIGHLCKTIKCNCKDEHLGCIEPYDRLSGYMSYEQATKQLQTIRN